MNFAALPERLAHVRAEIARRQATAGRAGPVTIVAVTKGFGLDAVEAALAAGLADVGENRVQEALEKLDTPTGRRATWHLVGHLQRNKAKHLVGRFALLRSEEHTSEPQSPCNLVCRPLLEKQNQHLRHLERIHRTEHVQMPD